MIFNALRARLRAPASSSDLATQTVQVASEASARPIITAFTTQSAAMNMPHGDRSCGRIKPFSLSTGAAAGAAVWVWTSSGEGDAAGAAAGAGLAGAGLEGASTAGAAGAFVEGFSCAKAEAAPSKPMTIAAAMKPFRQKPVILFAF